MQRYGKRTQTGPVRVVGYVRVSTDEQARFGVSLDAQRQALEDYCRIQNHELVDVFSDQGKSGTLRAGLNSESRRAGLWGALSSVGCRLGDRDAERTADGLIVMKLDRLSRNAGYVISLADDAKQIGWHLISIRDNLDTTTPIGRFFLQMMGCMAELESGQTGDRVRIAMHHLRREKNISVSRFTPFGYRLGGPDGDWQNRRRDRDGNAKKIGEADRRPLVPCPAEQAMLRDILKMDSEAVTVYRIASSLNRSGRVNPRSGKAWHGASIAAILKTIDRHAPKAAS